ncbi:hypothetical protein J1N35_004528 [Gossypium stocksii]|uniref:Uncharacterized protein n=1 Tax=Gossypium stocksii TaxID=47602 RepID=A0A9D4AI43_9ROSI|nr:hypothetical protein J1N35_004528 [Gossypium stocksii]
MEGPQLTGTTYATLGEILKFWAHMLVWAHTPKLALPMWPTRPGPKPTCPLWFTRPNWPSSCGSHGHTFTFHTVVYRIWPATRPGTRSCGVDSPLFRFSPKLIFFVFSLHTWFVFDGKSTLKRTNPKTTFQHPISVNIDKTQTKLFHKRILTTTINAFAHLSPTNKKPPTFNSLQEHQLILPFP